MNNLLNGADLSRTYLIFYSSAIALILIGTVLTYIPRMVYLYKYFMMIFLLGLAFELSFHFQYEYWYFSYGLFYLSGITNLNGRLVWLIGSISLVFTIVGFKFMKDLFFPAIEAAQMSTYIIFLLITTLAMWGVTRIGHAFINSVEKQSSESQTRSKEIEKTYRVIEETVIQLQDRFKILKDNVTVSSQSSEEVRIAFQVGAMYKNKEPDTGDPDWTDDTFADDYSSWAQHEAGHKPNVTAPGTTDWLNADGTALDKGTSYSAPHVAGVIAQLIQKTPSLATSQSSMNAILAVGVGRHKTADDYGQWSHFPWYSDKEGAGVVDARWSYYIVNNSRYKTVKLFQADFPYTTTFYVGSSDTLIRVAIHWLKQNRATTTTHGGEDISDPPLSNLNLYVDDPNGNLIGSSRSSNSNIEVVEFAPKTTGYHKLRIEAASISNDYEYVGIAWW